MLLVRVVVLVVAVGLGVLVLAWALTGNRKYLRYARRLATYGLFLVLLFLVLLAFERVALAAAAGADPIAISMLYAQATHAAEGAARPVQTARPG